MNLKSAIESLLFLQGDPMEAAKLAKIIGVPKKEIEAALCELAGEYAPTAHGRGIILVEHDGRWQFATNPANREVVKKFATADLAGELTKPALEVLAIVAYRGPLSRAEIEYIRGVDSSSALRTLLLRALIDREENPKDHRSYLYRVTHDFLRHLGLTAAGALPDYEELRKKETPAPLEGAGVGEAGDRKVGSK